ncbi:MAG: HAMP domain-containing sensor histidine kinase [Desulfobulbaceae bacterium]
MKSTRLLWQLFPANLLIISVSILSLVWYGTVIVRDLFAAHLQPDLEARALLISDRVVDHLITGSGKLQEFCRQLGRQTATRITVVAPDGKVLADSNEDPGKMDNHARRPELLAALAGQVGSSRRFSNTIGEGMYYLAIPLIEPGGRQIGALRMAVPSRSAEKILRFMYLRITLGAVLVLLLTGLASLLVSRRISRPLEEMKRGAEKLARGETDNIVTMATPGTASEVAALARSLNRVGKQIKGRINTITLQRNELETVFASMAEMVLAIDTEKRIIRINRSAAALFYLSPEDVQGKMLHGVIRNKDLRETVDEVLATGKQVEKDIIVFVGAEKLFLQTRAVPLAAEDSRPIGVLVVLNDMTRLHKLENLRRDFVANVSHELKTPVTSIQGYVETLLDGALDNPEDARRFLETVARQTSRLNAIIDDLLMLSRIELKTEHQEISLIAVKVCEVLASAVQTCHSKATGKNIRVAIDCDPDLTAQLNPNLIEQAVINLLTNAITYSPENTVVTVNASVQDRAAAKDRLVISVQDHGIGIEPDQLERLFERFYRTDKARSSASGGTGLGLSIVKHIAIAHKGSVKVQSEPGRGSTFSIVLPQ